MSNSRGGIRDGAGQKKKTKSDKWRIRIWYELVCNGIEHPIDDRVTHVWNAISAAMEKFIPDSAFGGETAWYAYAKGDRYPHQDFALNIDRCIVARNRQSDKLLIKHPIRWVLTRPGEIDSKLSPVWGWSPFGSDGLQKKEIPLAAKVHSKFFKRVHDENVLSYLQETGLLSTWDEPPNPKNVPGTPFVKETPEWQPHDYKWPPILLLPKVLAECCTTCHPDLPLPFLQDEPPGIDDEFADVGRIFNYEKMLREFAEWSVSAPARAAGGDVWLEKISAYLNTIFFHTNNPDDSAAHEINALKLDIVEFAESISVSFADRPRRKREDDPFCLPSSKPATGS